MTEPMKDITFSHKAPEALCVTLVGDFTQWQRQPIPLNKREDGLWQVTLRLPPGTYAYAFLVDDKWREDRRCNVPAPKALVEFCGQA